MRKIDVSFRVLRAEEWSPIDRCLEDIPGVMQDYLQIDALSCCDMQGGFFIDIDGAPWSDDGTVDEFRMTMTWLTALHRLCQGSTREQVWAWEESRLTLVRSGDQLEMEDIHHTGAVVMPRVRVSFVEFTGQILREARKFGLLAQRLRAEAVHRRQDGVDEQTLQEIEHHLPPDLDQVLEDLGTALAAQSRKNT